MKRSHWNVLAGLVVVAGLTVIVGAQSTAPAQTKQAAPDEFLTGTYPTSTPGLTLPKATKMVQPKYTPDAMRMKIQGDVKVQVVVAVDGSVDRARVIESLSPATGLDDAAIEAAKKWTFEPGKLKDKAVPVATEVVLTFRLH